MDATQRAAIDDIYGPRVVALTDNGWTLDSAVAHVDGTCDRALCTGVHHETDAGDIVGSYLERLERALTAARAALADEAEGAFSTAVNDLHGAATGLHDLVRWW